MKKNIVSVLILSSFIFAGEQVYSSPNGETHKAAVAAGATFMGEIDFPKGSADISEGAKKELREVIALARKKGELREVRVAAWADYEYPAKGAALNSGHIDLAEKRAENVQVYLEQAMNVSSISTINMAERPSDIQNLLNTPGAKTKNNLETSGAAPNGSNQTGLFGLKGKASKALVLVYN